MKVGFYWSYSTRSLIRGGQRTILAIFCVAVGVLAIVSLQLVGSMGNAVLASNGRALNGGDLNVHAEGNGLSTEQLTYFETLKAQRHITAYTAVGNEGVLSQTPRGVKRYSLYSVDPATFPLAGSPILITPSDGSLPTLLRGNTVVITQLLAQSLGYKLGDNVTFTADDGRNATVHIGGIIQNSGIFAANVMLMNLQSYSSIPSLTGAPVGFNWVYVDVPGHSGATADTIGAQIRKALPLVSTTTVQQNYQQSQVAIQTIRHFLQIMGLLALLIGGVGIIHTLQVLLQRRQLEIAMLKTIGYRQRDLALLFGLETSILGLLGGILGAGAGIGVSLLVRIYVERAIFLTLPIVIDPLVVLAGVVIGLFTSLIFGLLPIVQSGQVRPIAVLREMSEGKGWRSVFLSMLLVLLLAFLFFLLAWIILNDFSIALIVVLVAGFCLFLLSMLFTFLAWLVSIFPVPDALRWWYALPVALALLVTAWLTVIFPGFGLLLLVLAVCSAIVVLLPRAWKANVRMAIRNIGRQKLRNAITLLALFIGVFAVGAALVFGSGLENTIRQVAATSLRYNAIILVQSKDKSTFDQQLVHAPGLKRQLVNLASPNVITAVNGTPVQQLLHSSPGGNGAGLTVSGVEGFNLSAHSTPDVTLEQGVHDSHTGRNLTAQDANALNALMPLVESQTPFNLKLGDTLTISSLDGKVSLNLHVVGFYTSSAYGTFAPILVDTHVVQAVSQGAPFYLYSLFIDPSQIDDTLAQLQKAVPSVVTLNIVDIVSSINDLLQNLVIVIEAVASLSLFAGLIIIANAVALALLERKRELGILKAIGYDSRSVLSQVLVENAVVGSTSAFLAMLLVTLVTSVIGKLVFQSDFGATPSLVLGIVVATALICMAIATFVSWSATRVRPIEVLRYE